MYLKPISSEWKEGLINSRMMNFLNISVWNRFIVNGKPVFLYGSGCGLPNDIMMEEDAWEAGCNIANCKSMHCTPSCRWNAGYQTIPHKIRMFMIYDM